MLMDLELGECKMTIGGVFEAFKSPKTMPMVIFYRNVQLITILASSGTKLELVTDPKTR